jgi:hypothetical protein
MNCERRRAAAGRRGTPESQAQPQEHKWARPQRHKQSGERGAYTLCRMEGPPRQRPLDKSLAPRRTCPSTRDCRHQLRTSLPRLRWPPANRPRRVEHNCSFNEARIASDGATRVPLEPKLQRRTEGTRCPSRPFKLKDFARPLCRGDQISARGDCLGGGPTWKKKRQQKQRTQDGNGSTLLWRRGAVSRRCVQFSVCFAAFPCWFCGAQVLWTWLVA